MTLNSLQYPVVNELWVKTHDRNCPQDHVLSYIRTDLIFLVINSRKQGLNIYLCIKRSFGFTLYPSLLLGNQQFSLFICSDLSFCFSFPLYLLLNYRDGIVVRAEIGISFLKYLFLRKISDDSCDSTTNLFLSSTFFSVCYVDKIGFKVSRSCVFGLIAWF